ncbi:MAG TPA: peptidoglycan-binding domain-containing protein [Pyrinomonadaceae bacterium]|jgi:peptidoglycan hydrolase-like protein with peptidoglycan-binding domain
MKKILMLLVVLSTFSVAVSSQQNSSSSATNAANSNVARKTGPIFRATKDQIKQAQSMLKQRALYHGEATGKLDADTRVGLKKYQEAEGLKVTGTLNRATLEKMNITLTDKQKSMPQIGNKNAM